MRGAIGGPVPRRWFNHQTLMSSTRETSCTRNMIPTVTNSQWLQRAPQEPVNLGTPLAALRRTPSGPSGISQWSRATCRNTGITSRMNALAAAASRLRYVAECSKLSLREVAGPSKGVEQHCVSNLWFARLAPGRAPVLYMEPSAKVSSSWARRRLLATSEAKRNPIRAEASLVKSLTSSQLPRG